MLRKIKTQDEISKKKKKRDQILIGTVLVVLLVVSTAGYSLISGSANKTSNNRVVENGYEFYSDGSGWKLLVEDQTFRFQYLPSELENISVEGNYDFEAYYQQPLYFHNPTGASEVLVNLQRYILRYQQACLNGTECKEGLPVKDCDSNIIVFIDGEETKVYNNQSCVFIEGDAIKGADAFLYELLGI